MENLVNYNADLLKRFYNKKTVLITGITGFKGSWLGLILKQFGANVIGYSLKPQSDNDLFIKSNLKDKINYNYYDDIKDIDKLKQVFNTHQPEIVFHLAAQALVRFSYDDPKLTYETNIMGSVNLLECIRKSKSVKSFIYVTSDKAYKNKEWVWGYRENDELGGYDPYSASKAAAEIVFHSYLKSFYKENSYQGIASVRAGNVIGGGDWSLDRIIPDCIKSISNRKNIKIRSPKATRPWQHVLEPLSGYILLAQRLFENPKFYNGSWNFGPNTNSVKTVKELTEFIIKIYKDGNVIYSDKKNKLHEATLLHLNCDKANQQLNWFPKWEFDETVKRTVLWYKKFLENPESAYDLTINDINKYFKK